jgi:hypothetical protein
VKEYGSKYQSGLVDSSGGAAAQISFAAPHLLCDSLSMMGRIPFDDPMPDSWNRCCWLTEEPHESLDVLGHRCHEELLANKL